MVSAVSKIPKMSQVSTFHTKTETFLCKKFCFVFTFPHQILFYKNSF